MLFGVPDRVSDKGKYNCGDSDDNPSEMRGDLKKGEYACHQKGDATAQRRRSIGANPPQGTINQGHNVIPAELARGVAARDRDDDEEPRIPNMALERDSPRILPRLYDCPLFSRRSALSTA